MARIARLERSLRAQTTGLVMFDTLHGYLHPQDAGKVRFLEERSILANLRRLHEAAQRVGMTTFYPSGAHTPDGSDTVERLTDTDMDLSPGGGADKPIKPR